MKGAPKRGTQTNPTLEREQSLRKEGEIQGYEAREVQLCGFAGLLQMLPCTDFSHLPKELPSFLTFNSKELHRAEQMLCFVMSQSSLCFPPRPYLSSKQARY